MYLPFIGLLASVLHFPAGCRKRSSRRHWPNSLMEHTFCMTSSFLLFPLFSQLQSILHSDGLPRFAILFSLDYPSVHIFAFYYVAVLCTVSAPAVVADFIRSYLYFLITVLYLKWLRTVESICHCNFSFRFKILLATFLPFFLIFIIKGFWHFILWSILKISLPNTTSVSLKIYCVAIKSAFYCQNFHQLCGSKFSFMNQYSNFS